jgi:hypothetical protein
MRKLRFVAAVTIVVVFAVGSGGHARAQGTQDNAYENSIAQCVSQSPCPEYSPSYVGFTSKLDLVAAAVAQGYYNGDRTGRPYELVGECDTYNLSSTPQTKTRAYLNVVNNYYGGSTSGNAGLLSSATTEEQADSLTQAIGFDSASGKRGSSSIALNGVTIADNTGETLSQGSVRIQLKNVTITEYTRANAGSQWQYSSSHTGDMACTASGAGQYAENDFDAD